MLCGGWGMCTVISVGPVLFLVTKEEILEEDNVSQILQNKAAFKKNDPAAMEQ